MCPQITPHPRWRDVVVVLLPYRPQLRSDLRASHGEGTPDARANVCFAAFGSRSMLCRVSRRPQYLILDVLFRSPK